MSHDGFIYHGYVRHRRFIPRPHYFKYRIQLLYLNLGRGDLLKRFPIISDRWPALGWLRRKDYVGDHRQSLTQTVLDAVDKELGFRPRGEIYLLTQLRYWGLVMNPLSIFYCYSHHGELVATVLQVTNTPWREQTLYVLGMDRENRQNDSIEEIWFDKRMHVSPFNHINMHYLCRMGKPGPNLFFHLENHDHQNNPTDATLCLHRKALTQSGLMTMVLIHPFHSVKVLLGIYSNALRLWLKRIPIYDHQPVNESPRSSSDQVSPGRES